VTGDDRGSSDWARYWRANGAVRGSTGSIEAMYAHFRSHVYHRHSHETYSFGVTDDGAQAFTCRGGHHVSAANMVMLFNPDDPHDGHAATGPGFTYRMIHITPEAVAELLGDAGVRTGGRPLFRTPVVNDPALARRLRLLHNVLTGTPNLAGPAPLQQHQHPGTPAALQQHQPGDTSMPLWQHEQLTSTLQLLTHHATRATLVPTGDPASAAGLTAPAAALIAGRIRGLLHDAYASPLTASDLAAAAGCSRYTATRAFTAVYGLAPSDYQRQLRLRAARALLTGGTSAAEAAATAGFADQAHLTRWFRRYYGVTPGVYRQAVGSR
jgi:AraC-like DNA-binding protein